MRYIEAESHCFIEIDFNWNLSYIFFFALPTGIVEKTCWLWVATCNASEQNADGWAALQLK